MMNLSKQDFEKKLLRDIQEEYKDSTLTNNIIKVITNDIDVTFSSDAAYLSYCKMGDFQDIKSSFLRCIKEMISSGTHVIDYNNVYPFIKGRNFNPVAEELIREHLFLDLDICYVSNLNESFRFILKSDQVDFNKLKENALKNLHVLGNSLIKMDKNHEIYKLHFASDFAATMILSPFIKRQIKCKLGNDYLFCVPSSTLLLVSKPIPTSTNIHLLKQIMASDPDINKISNNIYRHRNDGVFEYAYKSEG